MPFLYEVELINGVRHSILSEIRDMTQAVTRFENEFELEISSISRRGGLKVINQTSPKSESQLKTEIAAHLDAITKAIQYTSDYKLKDKVRTEVIGIRQLIRE